MGGDFSGQLGVGRATAKTAGSATGGGGEWLSSLAGRLVSGDGREREEVGERERAVAAGELPWRSLFFFSDKTGGGQQTTQQHTKQVAPAVCPYSLRGNGHRPKGRRLLARKGEQTAECAYP